MADDEQRSSFLSRWSQRKTQLRKGVAPAEPAPAAVPPPAAAPSLPLETAAPSAPAAERATPLPQAPPPPTMDDVAALGQASDYSRFVAPGVEPGVRNAAMKKLFTDPHFNVMDGLDIYIDDYGRADPIAPDMLRKMVQSKALGLFDDEKGDAAEPAAADAASLKAPAAVPGMGAAERDTADNPPHHEHADLQLQPDDAARRGGADEGAGPGTV